MANQKNSTKKPTPPVKNGGAGFSHDSVRRNTVEKSADNLSMMFEKYGVDELFENSIGEFFTKRDLAVASERGNTDKVKTHKK